MYNLENKDKRRPPHTGIAFRCGLGVPCSCQLAEFLLQTIRKIACVGRAQYVYSRE